MITQAIKRWLNKLFGWLSWRKSPETEYARVGSLLNKGVTQEPTAWSTIDGVTPPNGVAPLFFGQGETSCSTIDEWPERVIQPSPPPLLNEKSEQPPAQIPTTPPFEPTKTAADNFSGQAVAPLPVISPSLSPSDLPPPTAEQKLEFLDYLIKRGIVNEGFAEGQVPEQYKRN